MSGATRVKICGIRTPEALDAAVDAGADLIGFVHWKGSPRYLSIGDAEVLARALPPTTTPVSLFVDEALETMLQTPFRSIQLHGDEDEATCHRLKEAGHQVIRGFQFSPERLRRWDGCDDVDFLLVDGSAIGGTGDSLDHRALSECLPQLKRPVIVAGGLDPDNVAKVIGAVDCWGVDVSSGVESERGVKDPHRIRSFCRAVRSSSKSD